MRKTGIIYDVRSIHHNNLFDREHPESYKRTKRLYQNLKDRRLIDRMTHLKIDQYRSQPEYHNIYDSIILAHTKDHINKIAETKQFNLAQLQKIQNEYKNDVFFCAETFFAASLACDGVVLACESVCKGDVDNCFAIVRPPGHHAEENKAMGFCLFNNVAVAACHMLQFKNLKRILIVDWDVHHGNGTQSKFYDDPRVLYISLHRYDDGTFFPNMESANYDFIGEGPGKGFNINIPWNVSKLLQDSQNEEDSPMLEDEVSEPVGDADYMYAFEKIIQPVCEEFNPELVIVSAGFDAALGDDIGKCNVTPEGFGKMTRILKGMAKGNLVLALEGGYQLNALIDSAEACCKVLLGEVVDEPNVQLGCLESTVAIVDQCIDVLKPYWKCFS